MLDSFKETNSPTMSSLRTPVGVESNISTALRQAVVRIISVISRQLDGFFEDARYDWLSRRQPQASPGASEEDPSPFMLDMVNYLSLSMDNQLASLSPAHRTQVFRGTLQHCATALMVRGCLDPLGSVRSTAALSRCVLTNSAHALRTLGTAPGQESRQDFAGWTCLLRC